MLKHPIMIRLPAFEVTDGQWKISLFNRLHFTFTPHAHDTAGGGAHIFPVSTAYRVLIHPPQIGLGSPGQFRQRLRVHFCTHHSPDLHGS